jgi:hypothetical protein
MTMKLLDVMWFSGQQCVGIVRCDVEGEGIRYYVGSASGQDEHVDTDHIMAWGAHFPREAGDLLFGQDAIRNGDAVPVPHTKEYAETMIRVAEFYLENINAERNQG